MRLVAKIATTLLRLIDVRLGSQNILAPFPKDLASGAGPDDQYFGLRNTVNVSLST